MRVLHQENPSGDQRISVGGMTDVSALLVWHNTSSWAQASILGKRWDRETKKYTVFHSH